MTREGVGQGLAKELQATSFRLDQTVMDRITRSGDEARAALLLGAFFPKESQDEKAYLEKSVLLDKAIAKMAAPVQERLSSARATTESLGDVLARSWGPLDQPDARLTAELLADLLPVNVEQLAALASFAPDLKPLTARFSQPIPGDELASLLETIDAAVASVRTRARDLREPARLARETLTKAAPWIASTRPVAVGVYAKLLNRLARAGGNHRSRGIPAAPGRRDRRAERRRLVVESRICVSTRQS